MKHLYRYLATLVLSLLAPAVWAFDLEALARQLSQAPVARGTFEQHKALRALPVPLVSRGRFTLARDHGLLWHLQQPIAQYYRITPNGLWRQTTQGWQEEGNSTAAHHNRLFLAVLAGDTDRLQENFDLTLQGRPDAWQLTLQPKGLLLRQIFTSIDIQGGDTVERIALHETQGDTTRLQLWTEETADALNATEHDDFR